MSKKDNITTGIVLSLGSELLTALLLWAGLTVAGSLGAEGLEPASHVKWFGVAFVPAVLLLQHHAKEKHIVVTKTMIVVLFVTFVAFMVLFMK